MYNLHCHSLLSDGVLLPSELAVRYAAAGYKAIAITDHVDYSNIALIIKAILEFTRHWPKNRKIIVLPGIELTHLPPEQFQPLAKLIMLFEGTDFSHAYVKLDSIAYERTLIYQASGKAVNFEGNIHFSTHVQPVYEYLLEVEDSIYKSIMQFCIDNAGIPYGLKGTIGAGIVKIVKILHKDIKNPFYDGMNSEFCSELAARILNLVLLNQLNYEKFDDITPKDLKLILDKIPQAKRIL